MTGLKSSFAEALQSGDWKEFLVNMGDQISTKFFENVSNTLLDTFIGDFDLGSVFGGFGEDVQTGLTGALSEKNAGFKDIFSGFGDMMKNGLSGVMQGLQGLFSGGGSGGGLSSLISTGISFLGFSDGGVVPHVPGSRKGTDSVPAMLTPGERVLSLEELDHIENANRLNNSNGGGTTVNFNVTGDISRQTEKAIMELTPTITSMVNAQNAENG